MITKIRLQEYGPFREAEFGLAPLTVLVGPNASGKTMAMEALRRAQEAIREAASLKALDRLEEIFYSAWSRKGATENTSITFDNGKKVLSFPGTPSIEGFLPQIQLLKFEPETMRKASYLEARQIAVQQDGYGLATVLADMKLQDDERLEWIEEQVRSIIPSFEGVRFKRAQVPRTKGSVTGQELIFDMKDAHDISPSAVSDGTILVLGIVTSIASMTRSQAEDKPTLILIDDLERGLHPRALNELIACLRRMTEEMSVQILATSHSPYLLDGLKSEEVRLTGFLDDGSATICELSEHPEFERWKDVMTPGELWATAGEDWIRDVRK